MIAHRRATLSQKEELVPGLNAALRRNFELHANELDLPSQRVLCDFLRLRGDAYRPDAKAVAAVLQDVELLEVVKEMTASSLWEAGADEKMAEFVLELIDMIPQLSLLRKLRNLDPESSELAPLLDEFVELGLRYAALSEDSKKRLKLIGPKVRPLFLDFGFAPAIKCLVEHWERCAL